MWWFVRGEENVGDVMKGDKSHNNKSHSIYDHYILQNTKKKQGIYHSSKSHPCSQESLKVPAL